MLSLTLLMLTSFSFTAALIPSLCDYLGGIRNYISPYYFRTAAPWTRVFNLCKALPAGSDDPVATVRSLFDLYLANCRGADIVSLYIK
jgi:hypothetical protein